MISHMHELRACLPAGCEVGTARRGFDHSGSGFTWIERMRQRGWIVPAAWGLDGWDAGEWPLAAIAYRPSAPWFVASRVEGDLDVSEHASEGEMIAAVDRWVAWTWDHQGEGPQGLKLDDSGLPIDARHRGAFSWGRLDAARAVVA